METINSSLFQFRLFLWLLHKIQWCCVEIIHIYVCIILNIYFKLKKLKFCSYNFLNFILFNFTILYWFCHISKWICHRCTCVLHSFFYEDPRWVQAIIYEYLSFIDLFKSACSSIFSGTSFAFASFFHVYMLNLLVIIGNIK